jgi:hypothetical protein
MLVSRRTFFFGSLALPALAAKKKPEALRPGIVLILVDELPAFMLGSYGNKQVRTPNLDLLAQMGMRFTNHFSCVPAAVAGRNTLLTGRTPMQLGDAGNLSADDVPLASILRAAGYTSQEGDGAAAVQFLDGQTAGKPFFFTLNCPSLRPPYDNVPKQYLDMYAAEPFDGYAPDLPAANAADGKELLRNVLGNVRKAAAAVTALDSTARAACWTPPWWCLRPPAGRCGAAMDCGIPGPLPTRRICSTRPWPRPCCGVGGATFPRWRIAPNW